MMKDQGDDDTGHIKFEPTLQEQRLSKVYTILKRTEVSSVIYSHF